MTLGFLTFFGYFFVLSFFGWPLFVYEVCRHHLGFRYHAAGALAFLSVLISFMVLDTIGSALRIYGIEIGWWSWTIWGIWILGPFVLWLVFRLRRPRRAAYDDKGQTNR
jgi:hypothetical protein